MISMIKPSLGAMIVAALAAPALALAGDQHDFPREAVICKAREAVKIAERLTCEYDTFLRNRSHCAPTHRERDLLNGLKDLERRAGHVIKAASTGCMPSTINRRADYLRNVVGKTERLAMRVGGRNLPCDIPGELKLIDELTCEISALARTRARSRVNLDDHDHDRGRDVRSGGRDQFSRPRSDGDRDHGPRKANTGNISPSESVSNRRPLRSVSLTHGFNAGSLEESHNKTTVTSLRFGGRNWEVRIRR